MAPKASQRPQRPPLDPLGKLPPIVKEALLTQRFFWPIAAALLLADGILTLAIIRFISCESLTDRVRRSLATSC